MNYVSQQNQLPGIDPRFNLNGDLIVTCSRADHISYLFDRTTEQITQLPGVHPRLSPDGDLIGSIPIMQKQSKRKLTIEVGTSQLQHWVHGLQIPFCA